jgi:serine/threonine protein kinase
LLNNQLRVTMNDRVGEQWGNYRLIQTLGRGGFAEVYLGQHIRLTSQRAALKILLTHLTEADIDGFQREAETIVSLIHPHVVRVLDFALNEGIPFLVMDYAPGGSLRRRHPRGEKVELKSVVSYVQQVAEGLQYAHDRKIIHRDIKPDNMLIGLQGDILLSDFGIATIAHGTNSQSAQLAVGTLSYMAPEQIQEHPRPASDQYALAITVYEWLSGRLPFSGTFTEVAAKQMMVPPSPLRGSVPNLPPEVEQVVLTALSKEPRARFGSVQAFAKALTEASLGSETILMPPESRSEEWTMLAAPHTDPSIAPYPVQAVSPPPNTPTHITPPNQGWEIQQPFPVPIVPAAGMFDAAQPPGTHISPTPPSPPAGAQIPVTGETNQRRVSRRWVIAGLIGLGVVAVGSSAVALVELTALHSRHSATAPTPTQTTKPTPTPTPNPFTGKQLTTYTGHTGAVRTIDWSPDNKLIASGAEDKAVRIWNPGTGQTVSTYTQHPAELLSVAWSPDGTLIASSGRASSAQVWNASTGARILNYTGHTDDVHGVAWSLDSKLVASGSDDHTVQVWDARTGTLVSEYKGHTAPVESVQWSPKDANLIVTACDDRTVQIVNGKTGTLVLNYKGHTDWVLSARWSPDGKLIASAGRDKTVQVWNASTGVLLFKNTSHTFWIEKVAWSPDGKLIASVGDDHTVQVLEVSTGKLVFNRMMDNEMYAVAWSPNGKFLASGGKDKAAQIWSAT